jgi:hypothetical protein
VRIFSDGRQRGVFFRAHGTQKRPVKKLFAVRFYIGAVQKNSLSCVFSLTHGKHFFPPDVAPVTLFVAFVVR